MLRAQLQHGDVRRVFLYDHVQQFSDRPVSLHYLAVSIKADPPSQTLHFPHPWNWFYDACQHDFHFLFACAHMPRSEERRQALHGCKTLVFPVPREPSVLENMPLLDILIKISLLIKPSHYLQFAVNLISLFTLDRRQRRRRMAAMWTGTASTGPDVCQ